MEISVISPCYGAPTLLEELVRQIEETVSKLTSDYEIILVEDHSPDNSREIITEICRKNKRVKGVFLSRNFGQQYALNAGVDLSTGDYVVTLDCDLQNPPAQIKDLYEKIQEGYDIVFASRQNRPDNFFMTQGSHLFNKLMGFPLVVSRIIHEDQSQLVAQANLEFKLGDTLRVLTDKEHQEWLRK